MLSLFTENRAKPHELKNERAGPETTDLVGQRIKKLYMRYRGWYQGLDVRRGRIDIISEILQAASEEIGKTALVYRTNLNFNIVDKYLAMLSKSGLVSVTRSSPVKIKCTPKGEQFLRLYANLQRFENLGISS